MEEIVSRARTCLQAIEGTTASPWCKLAVRLLAARACPEGTTEALINYLPFADDDTVVQEIETALLAVGMRDGQPDSGPAASAERCRAHPPQPRRAVCCARSAAARDARGRVPYSTMPSRACACRPPSASPSCTKPKPCPS